MRFTPWVPARALTTVAATGAALSIAVFGAAPASAHVRVTADNPAPGSHSVLTFKVPNESEKGAFTTRLDVILPNVASASTESMPGWTATLDRDAAAGTVRSVTWTAAPGTGIGRDQFALFRISVKLPNDDSVSFPATQTYADGTVVKWDQPTAPGGEEPEHPVPQIALAGATSAGEHTTPMAQEASPDNSSQWLAGGALALSAVAVAMVFLVRRRS